MLTAMRPSSRAVAAARRPATPPATTAPPTAGVATHTWCLCSHLTGLAGVLKDRFSTIPPVRAFESSRDWFSSLPGELYLFICFVSVPCCPEGVSVSVVSTDTLEIMWTASRGAELYKTRAADSSEVILCNDTAPVCALSDLSCDSSYSVVVTPCSEISGCNRACRAHTKDTGNVNISQYLNVFQLRLSWAITLLPTSVPKFNKNVYLFIYLFIYFKCSIQNHKNLLFHLDYFKRILGLWKW